MGISGGSRPVVDFEILSPWEHFAMRPAADRAVWDGKEWRLTTPLTFRWRGKLYTVPAGCTFDGKSIPKWYRWRFERYDQGVRGAAIHDWIYRTPEVAISRKDADLIFRLAQREDFVGQYTRRVQWRGVQIGGRPSYRQRQGTTA